MNQVVNSFTSQMYTQFSYNSRGFTDHFSQILPHRTLDLDRELLHFKIAVKKKMHKTKYTYFVLATSLLLYTDVKNVFKFGFVFRPFPMVFFKF